MNWIETHTVKEITFDDLCELAGKSQNRCQVVQVFTPDGLSFLGWPCEVSKKQDFVILCPGELIKPGPESVPIIGSTTVKVSRSKDIIIRLKTHSWTKLKGESNDT